MYYVLRVNRNSMYSYGKNAAGIFILARINLQLLNEIEVGCSQCLEQIRF